MIYGVFNQSNNHIVATNGGKYYDYNKPTQLCRKKTLQYATQYESKLHNSRMSMPYYGNQRMKTKNMFYLSLSASFSKKLRKQQKNTQENQFDTKIHSENRNGCNLQLKTFCCGEITVELRLYLKCKCCTRYFCLCLHQLAPSNLLNFTCSRFLSYFYVTSWVGNLLLPRVIVL